MTDIQTRLAMMGYDPAGIAYMIDALCRTLSKFTDPEAATRSLNTGFSRFVRNRFADEQFVRFTHRIDPEVSSFYRDGHDESVYAPLEDFEREMMPASEITEFEEERRRYLVQAVQFAKRSHKKLENEMAYAPLFGVHYLESKRPSPLPETGPVRHAKLVYTPQGGQPGFRRKTRVR